MSCIMKRFILFLLLSSLLASASAARPTIFIVRHAEKAATGGSDPDLSSAGRQRAQRLANVLKDARISAIFVTELRRTRQTAAPLAQMLGLNPQVVPSNNSPLLNARVHAASGNILVVGHSNTIPDMIRGFGVMAPVQIGENDFDNLFLLVRDPTSRLIRLHYP
jgi:broad specificity phosphatase PhoE